MVKGELTAGSRDNTFRDFVAKRSKEIRLVADGEVRITRRWLPFFKMKEVTI